MSSNLLFMLLLVALVLLFGALAVRAWRSRRAVVRWPGVILAGLLTVLLALAAVLFANGMLLLYTPKAVSPVSLSLQSSPETLARGQHLASVLCASCHTEDGTLPLSGGTDLVKDIGLPLGTIVPPNVTPGGKIAQFSDADLFRILRTGIDPTGRLTFMAGVQAHNLSDEDLASIVAYLKSAPPVHKETPAIDFSPLGVFVLGAGLFKMDAPAAVQSIAAPAKAVTTEYGEYIVNFMDCRSCHGPTLSADGGPISPPGTPNLRFIVPQWTKDDFFTAMRTGVDKTGHQIRPPMPWKTIGQLDDTELEALYTYLHGLTPPASK